MRRLVLLLKGGLGNQLFQYAAARAIAHRNRVPLYLDAHTGFASDEYARKFRLHYFDIAAELLPREECERLAMITAFRRKLRSCRERCFIRYLGRAFDPMMLYMRVRDAAVLEGFWQSDRYFRGIGAEIRRELRVIGEVSQTTACLARQIREAPGVAVHIRRLHGISATGLKVEGRYGGNASQMSLQDYYTQCIQRIRAQRGNVHAFVFADAPEWARENIEFECPTTYVSHNGPERDYEDLLLMSMCRDHVIANSTFSWWGAWLGEAADKIVCAPRNFSPYQGMRPLRDVYPPSWVVI